MGIQEKKELPEPDQIERLPRSVQGNADTSSDVH
jgi:hypothetical protein